MTREEIIKAWGGSLRRWPRNSVEKLRISESSKDFLVVVGLPRQVGATLRFDAESDELPSLSRNPQYRIIGWDHGNSICVVEGQGKIVYVLEGGSESLFNSSVEMLGEFLTLEHKFLRVSDDFFTGRSKQVTKESLNKLLDTLENQMRLLDPAAFEDEENVWPSKLYDYKRDLG